MEPADKKFLAGLCLLATPGLAILAAFIVVVAVLDPPAEYSVAVTSLLTGVNHDAVPAPAPANGDGSIAVPALLNLTVHIKNPSKMFSVCVTADATAAVSYGGSTTAVVVGGAVPEFCAGREGEGEAAAYLWGVAVEGTTAIVLLPPPSSALRRGGAVVDVAVRVPRVYVARRSGHVYDRMITCSGVKVGGGLAPCTSTDK